MMGKIIMLIGRISSGKTTYARKVQAEENALRLSCDELMQIVFPEPMGDKYDVYSARCIRYLYHLGKQLAQGGANVVMDMGCWTKASRREAMEFFQGVEVDWRYLNIPEDEWRRRIASRNAAVMEGRANMDEYLVDEGLLAKATAMFEPPEADEGLQLTIITE